MHHLKGDTLAKLWLILLVFILILNSGILIGLQLMTTYTYDSIADTRAAYADYNLLDTAGDVEFSAVLLAAPGRNTRLLVTQKHFLVNRHCIVLDTEVDRHYSATAKTDQGNITVKLNGIREIAGFYRKAASLPLQISSLRFRVPLHFLLWNLLLLGLECLGGFLFTRFRSAY